MSTSYTYHGAAQAVTLLDAAGVPVWEGQLSPGATVTGLPADHPHVVTWLDARLLAPVPDEAAPEAPTEPTRRARRGQQED
ncbi:hypothetical protein J2X65_002035 [Ancylobacter sp. 3268]|uniref:hypothetical protein n=1 Tax=Ancylobacter sp. 3268 TaxID=2817752 RepID=UPI0028597FEE|nr:hypothetical protein [Ancylobacter sp. 3268]MDR6952676.1 hypothetical protein [Ancylobacter sp. 3268]